MTEVVAALIWDEDKFMICQRPAHKTRGLLWEFVGGKVEPGETREQALIRECQEELAVTVAPGDVFMEVDHEYPDLTVHLTLFNATIAEGTPQKLEHNDIRWITVDEIPNYDFCPADEEILKKLQACLQENLEKGAESVQDEDEFNFNKYWGPDEYRPRVVFERGSKMYCVYCGKEAVTREHCPSRAFLRKPYPSDLPVVPACEQCNNGFSSDELYTKAFIQYYQNYSYKTPINLSERRKEVRDAKKKFLEYVSSKTIAFDDRIARILIKLAVCHAVYELTECYYSEGRRGDVECVSYTFRPNMTRDEIDAADDFIPINECILPIVGSRAYDKIYIFGPVCSEGVEQAGSPMAVMDWTDVQDGYYRYVCWIDGEHINVKLVINEFLFATVVFKA